MKCEKCGNESNIGETYQFYYGKGSYDKPKIEGSQKVYICNRCLLEKMQKIDWKFWITTHLIVFIFLAAIFIITPILIIPKGWGPFIKYFIMFIGISIWAIILIIIFRRSKLKHFLIDKALAGNVKNITILKENFNTRDEGDSMAIELYKNSLKQKNYKGFLSRISHTQKENESKISEVRSDILDDKIVDIFVDQLIQYYNNFPEGIIRDTPAAQPIKTIGQSLYEKGGKKLMLIAYDKFASRNNRMKRNLEMVWHGIGDWQG